MLDASAKFKSPCMLTAASRGEEAGRRHMSLLGAARCLSIDDAPKYITNLNMIGLLSLTNDLIELVGKQVIEDPGAGLETWCRMTSTCQRLWAMQLPDSSSEWHLHMDDDIRGKSKMKQAHLAQGDLLCMCKIYHIAMNRCTVDITAHTLNKQALNQTAATSCVGAGRANPSSDGND